MIGVVGPGRVGGMLAQLAAATATDPPAAVTVVGRAQLGDLAGDALAEVDLLLIAVPDDALAQVAQQLAARLQTTATSGAVATHTSGLHNADVLAPLRARGFALASMHPLKTVPDAATGAATFAGTPCAVEGDPIAVARVTAFVERIGGVPFTLPAGGKARYHAAAVMACNYLVTLQHAASQVFGLDGPDGPSRALGLLLPLVRGTVDAVAAHGIPAALTGPIERGDVETVRAHIAALAGSPWLDAYRVLGRHTVDLAVAGQSIDQATAGRLRDVLRSAAPGEP
ncbi:MAG: Rossmann-like and DUF2520 domain-containing protein [Planctomycetota bacterium]